MRNTMIVVLAMIVLGICMLSGGCSRPDQSVISEWQELLKFPADDQQTTKTGNKPDITPLVESGTSMTGETITVSLYFADATRQQLVREDRAIAKVEGIAREAMEELLAGSANAESTEVFPAGTRLLDINLKPDGLCIVDLSSEACQVTDRSQAQLMVEAIAKTLGQFPAVQEVTFMINGEKIDSIGGYVDLSAPIGTDYQA